MEEAGGKEDIVLLKVGSVIGIRRLGEREGVDVEAETVSQDRSVEEG